jgi:hypothetical protein
MLAGDFTCHLPTMMPPVSILETIGQFCHISAITGTNSKPRNCQEADLPDRHMRWIDCDDTQKKNFTEIKSSGADLAKIRAWGPDLTSLTSNSAKRRRGQRGPEAARYGDTVSLHQADSLSYRSFAVVTALYAAQAKLSNTCGRALGLAAEFLFRLFYSG